VRDHVPPPAGLPLRAAGPPPEREIHGVLTLRSLDGRNPDHHGERAHRWGIEKYFRDDGESRPDPTVPHTFEPGVEAWLFPQVLAIAKQWLAECLVLKNAPDTFPQLLLLLEFAHDAADRIYQSIVAASDGEARLHPIPKAYDPLGSTRSVDFDTVKPVWPTRADKCHVSHVVADTGSWEQKMAQVLEELDEVTAYVKNQGLDFVIPYTLNGESKQYVPDFLVKAGPDFTLIVEVSGEARKDKAAKVAAARNLWMPAVNNHGGFGRWGFVEVTDPWDAKGVIRRAIEGGRA
jgi:type III restriction enzyme